MFLYVNDPCIPIPSIVKHYYVLFLGDQVPQTQEAEQEAIKKGFRKFARTCHPDLFPPDQAVKQAAIFREAMNAYNWIMQAYEVSYFSCKERKAVERTVERIIRRKEEKMRGFRVVNPRHEYYGSQE